MKKRNTVIGYLLLVVGCAAFADPTNTVPASVAGRTVMCDTNGAVVAPTNFVDANGIATTGEVATVAANLVTVSNALDIAEATLASTTGTVADLTSDLATVSNRTVALEGRSNVWNTAYGWGDHSAAGYADETAVSGQISAVSNRVTDVEAETNDWNTAYGWGDHSAAGYADETAVSGQISAVSNRVAVLETNTHTIAEADALLDAKVTAPVLDYGLTYTSIDATTTSLTGYTGTPVNVVVPGTDPATGKTVVSADVSAFAGDTNLVSIVFSTGLTNIAGGAFDTCTSLVSVVTPESLIGIGDYAFAACSSLASITLPEELTSVGTAVFGGCTSLTSITLPDGLATIQPEAFTSAGLTSIIFPDGVTNIYDSAFDTCTNLVSLVFRGDAPALGAQAFLNVTGTVYYHASATGFTNPWGGLTTAVYTETNDWNLVVNGTLSASNIYTDSETDTLLAAKAGTNDMVTAQADIAVMETNTYTISEADALLDAKAGTNDMVTAQADIAVLETNTYTISEADALLDAKANVTDGVLTNATLVGHRTIQVAPSSVDTNNGTLLLTAYSQAQGMSPAVSNDVSVILPPATYDLGAGTLAMTTEYINVIGQIPITLTVQGYVDFGAGIVGFSAVPTGEMPLTIIKSSGTAISNSVDNAIVKNVLIDGVVLTAGDNAAVWKNVYFSGLVDDYRSNSNTFIGVIADAGICTDATSQGGGENVFNGSCENSIVSGSTCLGGSFGGVAGVFHGSTISGYSCIGGDGGQVATNSTFKNTTISGTYSCGGNAGGVGGQFSDCYIYGAACAGGSGGTIESTAVFNNCVISGDDSVAGGGYGTIEAGAVFTGCRLYGDDTLGYNGNNYGTFLRTDIFDITSATNRTYSTNTVFSFCTGVDPEVTNSPAKVFNSADSDYNLIPNQ